MRAAAVSTERPESFSAAQARAFRLGRHHLHHRAPRASLVSVVQSVCGIQAQLASAANLSARVRVEDLSPGDVEHALLADRSLVRTWCLRSTVHLVASRDLPMLAGALALRARRDRERWAAARGMRPGDLAAPVLDVIEALGDAPATYAQVKKAMVEHLPRRVSRACDDTALAQLVQTACVEGLLVSGPMAGARTTFVRPERWLSGSRRMQARAAQDALLRRYLKTYAPATLHDFASWSGLALGDARPIWARLAETGETVEVGIDGGSARMLREDLPAARAASLAKGHVRLLPAYDVYLLGHRDKGLLASAAHLGRIFRKAARVSPVLLVDGSAAGIWSCGPERSVLRLRVEPFDQLSKQVREGIDAEAADISRFLGERVEIELGGISSPSFVI